MNKRTLYLIMLMVLTVLTSYVWTAETPPSDIEVIYIPQVDIARSPGYSTNGVYLPLGELLSLAEQANRSATAAVTPLQVYCTSLQLKGTLEDYLLIEGTLEFTAPDIGWTATLIDDGQIPWSGQNIIKGRDAFLTFVNGKTYLYAKGRAQGIIEVRAHYRVTYVNSRANIELGSIFAPCRIEIDTGKATKITSPNMPLQETLRENGAIFSLAPIQGQSAEFSILREIPFESPQDIRYNHQRTVTAKGSGLDITDNYLLRAKFKKGEQQTYKLPSGLSLLNLGADSTAASEIKNATLIITPLDDIQYVNISARFAAPLQDGCLNISTWDIPGIAVESQLIVNSSETHIPIIQDAPPQLMPRTITMMQNQYEYWGKLPALKMALVPRAISIPPDVYSDLSVTRNQANASYTLRIKDPNQFEFHFMTPDGWVLDDLQATKNTLPIPCAIQQRKSRDWRVRWQKPNSPDTIQFFLHRIGSWGAPKSTTTLDIPFIELDDPQPLVYKIIIIWPQGLNIRPAELTNAVLVPESSPQESQQQSIQQIDSSVVVHSTITVSAAGGKPAGMLEVEGREADVRATIVSALSIGDDRTIVRALVDYQVRIAPTHTFNIVLPKNTGANVRISGEGIRETIRKVTDKGDVWTIVTQNDILDRFRATFEWQLDTKRGDRTISAPEIYVSNVTSQQGFIILEGSETMRLNTMIRNLIETDLAEVPPVPWQSDKRILAVYRYIQPPYELQVSTEQFEPEPQLAGLVKEAEITATISGDGHRFTRAAYRMIPLADRQFFEFELPENAELWGVLIDNEGTQAASRKTATGAEKIMVSLPATPDPGRGALVHLLYHEIENPLERATRIHLKGPKLEIPVNRTVWNLNLPAGFEYLTYSGTLLPGAAVREPLLTFLRSAYYPEKILSEDISTPALIIITAFVLMMFFGYRNSIKKKRERKFEKKDYFAYKKPGRKALPTLLEFLIVLAIIAILAAIAVPNFLESQVRSRVSRVKSDARTMATAIEAYYVDNNAYPYQAEILWQGPVKYLSTSFIDPYSDSRMPLKYVRGRQAVNVLESLGYVSRGTTPESNVWLVYSVGPDGIDNNGTLLYDPTNGTVSPGDVIYSNYQRASTFDSRYTQLREGERKAGAPQAAIRDHEVNGIQELKAPGVPAEPQFATEQPMPTTVSSISPQPTPSPAELFDFKAITYDYGVTKEVERYKGLLSLDIEIPSGGVQRRFEVLSYETDLNIRMLNEERFLRLRFIVWFAAFLIMGIIWMISRNFYKITFILGIAITLIIPILKTTPWIVFYNTAFQGLLFSLVIPLAAILLRRLIAHLTPQLSTAMMLCACLVFSFDIIAGEDSGAQDAHKTLRIVVPYSDTNIPASDADPLAFIGKEQFSTLWNAAQNDIPIPEKINPLLGSIVIEGTLNTQQNLIEGTLTVFATNPNDVPGTVPLLFSELQLIPSDDSSQSPFLKSTADGLLLHMEHRWMGEIKKSFTLPCNVEGMSGRFKVTSPDIAVGYWQITLPYQNVTAESRNGIHVISEKTERGSIIKGNMIPGTMEVTWKGLSKHARTISEDEQGKWSAEITDTLRWNNLSYTMRDVGIHLQTLEPGCAVPEYIRLGIPADVRFYAASGDDLLGTTISNNEVLLRIKETPNTMIFLYGIQQSPSFEMKDNISNPVMPWTIQPMKPLDDIPILYEVWLRISDRIEILSINPERLTRKAEDQSHQKMIIQRYSSTDAQWKIELSLRRQTVKVRANITEVNVPEKGYLHRVVSMTLTPRDGLLQECTMTVPSGVTVANVSGNNLLRWTQYGEKLYLIFNPGLSASSQLHIISREKRDISKDKFSLSPFLFDGAKEVKHSLVVMAPPDEELSEVDLSGAVPRGSTKEDLALIDLLPIEIQKALYTPRAYDLPEEQPMQLRLAPITASARITVYNRVSISEGLESVSGTIRAEPRRGRLQEIEVFLLLKDADPDIASRLRISGPIRDYRIENVSERLLRIVAVLSSPYASTVYLRFSVDQPVNTEGGQKIGVSLFLPKDETGARALLLVHKALDGELEIVDRGGARDIDPEEWRRPGLGPSPLPADQTYEVSLKAETTPTFLITRHEREEGLRAIVEILRQRSIITPDGIERNELEIALQNQSEQFLKVGLPYKKSEITIYEVQVASRVVKTTFGMENGREVLLIPLIRTGLLEPELTVRVAYTVQGRETLRGSGKREQHLPEILGGIPVAQSALVLMLPSNLKYSDFSGTLNPVELVDIEVGEAFRQAKLLEKVSELALYGKGVKQKAALSSIEEYQRKVVSKLEFAEKTTKAYQRTRDAIPERRSKGLELEDKKLADERLELLRQAQVSNAAIGLNVDQLRERYAAGVLELEQQPQAMVPIIREPQPTPEPPTPPIEFPRVGDVFAFRQLQGTGHISFEYVTRESIGKRYDIIVFIVLIALVTYLTYQSRRLFTTQRRLAVLIFVLCGVSIIAGFAYDVAIPGIGIAIILFNTAKRKRQEQT